MATANISINPATQSTFAGTFFVSSEGYTQGDALDDPAIRFSLRGGIVSTSATVPMWGGLLVTETLTSGTGGVGATAPAQNLESILSAATSLSAGNAAGYLGVTVFNQSTAMIQSAQSRVPMAPSGGAINFYRVGSGARIPMLATSAAVAAWAGGVTDPQTIYWDTANYCLTNASGGGIIGPITNMYLESVPSVGNSRTVSYSSVTNFANWVENGYTVVVRI
jgi:hypothetical protein